MRYSDYAFLVRFTLSKCRTEYRVSDIMPAGHRSRPNLKFVGCRTLLLKISSYPKEPIPRLAVIEKFSGSVCPVPKSEHVRTEVNGGIKKP